MISPVFCRFCLASGAIFLAITHCATPVHALPTTNPLPGISGLGVIPTTDSVAPGILETSLVYERVKLHDADGHVDLLPVASLNYGFGKGEVGATYVRERSGIEGFSLRNSYYAVQGKARVYERSNLGVALGAHFYDFGSDGGFDLGNVLSGYVTASYAVGKSAEADATGESPKGRLHAGLLVQRVRGEGARNTLVRPFAGAEYGLGRNVSLAADYLSSDKDAARAFTLSLRYLPPASPLSAQIGVGKLRRDTKFFVGLSYGFGGGRRSSDEVMPEIPLPTSQTVPTPSQGVGQ